MNKFLKVALATVAVFAVQDVCSASSCSKSGFYFGAAIKGKRQCATFEKKDDLKPVAERLQNICVELITVEQAEFKTANDAATAGAAGIFTVNVGGAGAGHFGIPLNDRARADFAKNFPAIRTALMLGGLQATANNVVNVATHFGNTHLEYGANTWHAIAVDNQSHIGVDILNAFEDSAKFNKWLESAKANSGKNYATLPTSAKYEYSEGKKWSVGAELSVGWSQRVNDFVVNIGGIVDFMFARNKISCQDTGIASAENNTTDKDNKSKDSTNDYGVDLFQKPSFGGEIECLYNLTKKFLMGVGLDVWYKRYSISTNKLSDLFVLKEGYGAGELVKAMGGSLDTYNKDALATGIADKAVKANGCVFSPYIKMRWDFNQNVGIFAKAGYGINKAIVVPFGTVKVGGFHTSFGVNIVF